MWCKGAEAEATPEGQPKPSLALLPFSWTRGLHHIRDPSVPELSLPLGKTGSFISFLERQGLQSRAMVWSAGSVRRREAWFHFLALPVSRARRKHHAGEQPPTQVSPKKSESCNAQRDVKAPNAPAYLCHT